MGIKGLNVLLRSVCADVFRTEDISLFRFKKVAIDAAMYVFKYKIVFGAAGLNGAYIELITRLRENKIHPVFVFDGVSPKEKSEEHTKRASDKARQAEKITQLEADMAEVSDENPPSSLLMQTYKKIQETPSIFNDEEFDKDMVSEHIVKLKARIIKPTVEDYDMLRDTLDAFNVPWIRAPGEAEILCAQLCKQGIVNAVITSDTDVLAAGCPVMIKDFGFESLIVVCIDDILSSLGLTQAEFTDLCIMCGTDFNKNIPKIGPKTAYKLVKEHSRIEKIPLDTTILNHVRSRELLYPTEEWTGTTPPYSKPICYEELEQWMKEKKTSVDINDVRNRIQ